MIIFYSLCCLMLGGAGYFIAKPFIHKDNRSGLPEARPANSELNQLVLKDQMNELERDLQIGQIGASAFALARQDLEMRVLQDIGANPTSQIKPSQSSRRDGFLIGFLFIVFVSGIYAWRGSPHAIDELALSELDMIDGGKVVSVPAVGQDGEKTVSIDTLRRLVAQNPNDTDSLDRLAVGLHAAKEYQASADTYAKLVKMIDPDANLLADYADTLAMAQQRDLRGQPEKLIEQALLKDPRHLKALALAGSAAFSRKDYRAAAAYWKRIIPLVEVNSSTAQSTLANIKEAEELDKEGSDLVQQSIPMTSDTGTVLPVNGKTLIGEVSVTGALRTELNGSETVFVFAKAVDGSKMPLAVMRRNVNELPFEFNLDDSTSMLPNLKLSGFDSVIVSARISKSGNAIASSGDLESENVTVTPGTRGIKLEIKKRHP